jgi:riboflavin biosynthesis pyrimidine reductase
MVFPAGDDGRVQIPLLLHRLAELDVKRLMVEGGSAVITSFLREGLVDLLVLTIAPILVGGQPGIDHLLCDKRSSREGFPQLLKMKASRLGDDLIVWGFPQRQG